MGSIKKQLVLLGLIGVFLSAVNIQSAGAAGLRKYYLTKDTFVGDQVLSACAKGYHTASLWEIFNMSTLRYNTSLGFTTDDSGFGPPTNAGWIRTGHFSNDSDLAGQANCLAWTSSSGLNFGTVVALQWSGSASSISPWQAFVFGCIGDARVWCVEN